MKNKEHSDCKVFATDAILATLMTCARSNYSWDITAQRIGDVLFLDKRDESEFGEELEQAQSSFLCVIEVSFNHRYYYYYPQ